MEKSLIHKDIGIVIFICLFIFWLNMVKIGIVYKLLEIMRIVNSQNDLKLLGEGYDEESTRWRAI